ncbi:MAG TPA: outer membrane beta-barrel protein [Casimicrobiaceae bacterium]
MTEKQALVVLFLIVSAAASAARAQERPAQAPGQAGFYGGVALRDAGTDAAGVNLGHLASAWGRFASPVSDDTARRALVFGGYRWANDLAVEGSFSTADRYALRPSDAAAPRGVGLTLASTPELGSRTWNADVYTSWSFRSRFSLYGRLGYAQGEPVPSYALAALPPSEPRRLRDGVNYGVGVRYDVTPALGLRLEYARFSRFAGEAVTGPLPDSDQLQFGMQFRF